jgi:D-alanyl-D-alanine carboxypeptidase/D-alanyl-D-alanine-endopeptidase (penicillin-binding protein 4)
MLAKNGLTGAITLEEGSGISRGNRFTARGLAKVLNLFAPHMDLLESGKGASYKTGTLDGVRTLAGYLSSSEHGPVRFVIALKGNNGAMRFELLKAVESEL